MAIIGIGTEIVECVRIAKMIETHGEQFLERVYTANEIEYCVQTPNAAQFFATRWAAKEAVMKALRCRHQGVRWTDIEVVVNPGEGPGVILSNAAALFGAAIRRRTIAPQSGCLPNSCHRLRRGDRRIG